MNSPAHAEKPRFVYVIWIQSTAAKVFAALQDPEMTRDFWGRSRNVSTWNAGATWQHQSYDDASIVDVNGEVVEIDAPRKLVLTWASAHAPGDVSRVTFSVDEQFGAVKLTVTHEELSAQAFEMTSMGWTAILSSLKSLLETGKAMPSTMRRWTR